MLPAIWLDRERSGSSDDFKRKMADVFSSEKRSEIMSRIRSRDTTPELLLRAALHRLGLRFTVNGPLKYIKR